MAILLNESLEALPNRLRLGEAGFAEIENREVSDIYRITTATRP
jgi:hypothetical protein